MMAEARSLRWWTAQQLAALAATLEAELAERLVRQHSLDLADYVDAHCDFLD